MEAVLKSDRISRNIDVAKDKVIQVSETPTELVPLKVRQVFGVSKRAASGFPGVSFCQLVFGRACNNSKRGPAIL